MEVFTYYTQRVDYFSFFSDGVTRELRWNSTQKLLSETHEYIFQLFLEQNRLHFF